MTPEEREAPLTAYALSDPGLSANARQDIETLLAADPAARRAVEETRQLARLLTEGLAAEQAATPAGPVVTIPPPKPARRPAAGWTRYVVAAAVLVAAFGGTYLVWSNWKPKDERGFVPVAERASPPNGGDQSRFGDGVGSGGGGWADDGRHAQENKPAEGLPHPDMPTAEGGAAAKRDGGARRINPTPADSPAPTTSRPGRPGVPGLPPPPAPPAPGTPGFGGGVPGGVPGGGPGLVPPVALPGPAGGRGAPGGSSIRSVVPESRVPATEDLPPRGDVKEDDKHSVPNTRDRFGGLQENSFVRVEGVNALSTFGVDVDTASYAIVRKYLSMGQLPPPSAIRLEEMVNYFPYQDKAPEGEDPFAVTVEMAECPWEPAHRLVRLGLKAKPIDNEKRPPSNIVFLIDVSGSMNQPNKLPLVKAALKLLVNQLNENDRVAMVVYAGASGLVLDSTSATKKETILNALDQLQAGGSTNGAGGLQQAYDVAVANFIKNGTNRVILCTDGDWNVGTTSTDGLVKLIEQKRETGVFLSVFGFGMGNLRDEMMVKLAGKGNGNYGYIDNLREANKALVEQIGGTLVTVAKDVKIQVEFNPASVKAYRLLGYEKRALAAKDFHDDKKDAGEMGAGHVVTALYELVPVGAPDPVVGKVDGLRYQPDPVPAKAAVKSDKVDEAFVVKMRHKKPDADKSTLRELPVSNVTKDYEKASEDFQFAASVASFAMLLRDSAYKGQSNYGLVLELAEAARKHDPGGYRAEFIEMVKKAKALSGK
jgi:Ca-activated chloride channel family protein